jgi:UDP-glucose 4-epimerase
MKVLVVGGSGFIGSHIMDALSDEGHEVTNFDLQPSRYLRKNQQYVQGNILNRDQIKAAITGKDVVYNFAGIPHLDVGLNNPVATVEQNILGTVISLDASKDLGVKRYVYASSVYVYSERGSFYRCSKQAAELYVEEYQRLHGMEYTILRYGTVFGPRSDDHNSVRRYLQQALQNRRIVINGTGDEIREYIHVKDASRLSVEILAHEYKNEYVVLSGQHPMRFMDLLKMIQEMVGSDVEIELRPVDPNDPKRGLSGHYSITPYSFRPKVAKKLVSNPYMEMGQGLLDCLHDICEEEGIAAEETQGGLCPY